MKLQNPSPKLLRIWRWRVIIAAFFLTIIGILALLFFPWAGLILLAITPAGLWVGWIYCAARYKAFEFEIKKSCIVIYKNVFFKSVKTIPLPRLLFVRCAAPPLHRLYGLTYIVLKGGGAKAVIPGVEQKTMFEILEILGYSD